MKIQNDTMLNLIQPSAPPFEEEIEEIPLLIPDAICFNTDIKKHYSDEESDNDYKKEKWCIFGTKSFYIFFLVFSGIPRFLVKFKKNFSKIYQEKVP